MKTKLILFVLFLFLSITAYAAPGLRISDYPNMSSLTSNKLFVIADPGVATYNSSFGQLTNQVLNSTELTNKVSSIAGSASAGGPLYTNATVGGFGGWTNAVNGSLGLYLLNNGAFGFGGTPNDYWYALSNGTASFGTDMWVFTKTGAVFNGLSYGLFPAARGPAGAFFSDNGSGTLSWSVNGSGLTNLNASNLASGTVPPARLPDLSATYVTNAALPPSWLSNANWTGMPYHFYVNNPSATSISGQILGCRNSYPGASICGVGGVGPANTGFEIVVDQNASSGQNSLVGTHIVSMGKPSAGVSIDAGADALSVEAMADVSASGSSVSGISALNVASHIRGVSQNNVKQIRGIGVFPNTAATNNGTSWVATDWTGTNVGIYLYNQAGVSRTRNVGIWGEDMSGTTNDFFIWSAGGNNYFGGNVGIGTQYPQQALDIQSDAGTTINEAAYSGTASVGSGMNIIRGRGTRGSPSAVVNGDRIATWNFYGYSGTQNRSGAYALVNVDDTVSTGAVPMSWTFAAGGNNLLSLRSAGYVGVNTTSPTRVFNVQKDSTVYTDNASFGFGVGDGVKQVIIGYDTSNDAGVIASLQAGVAWKSTCIMQGNVGIHRISPQARLDVNGNVNISGSTTNSESVIATNGFASYSSNQLAVTSITVTGSPFNWTNTTTKNVNVSIYGGEITDVKINGSEWTSGDGHTLAPLQPGEWTTVTYALAPSMKWKPY